MVKGITKFLSNRTNLTILQCILYFIIGSIMGEYLTWVQFGIMFIVLFIIQFITRTKAVADGMVYRQIMMDHKLKANDIIEKIKEQVDNAKKEDIN